ncbi:hypothetical protein [Nocardiopsis algeriensis]|uniref:Uncharacterized protein n=1 Tax=Nocardiopsis algeriensis TaxID=1478215 RepID=A0A841ISF7_9ACTN|nr:hypothetical protein [Nocardiopsis algeriensis]MBB6121160.1 hypothetical protein [Nocardiopsis algeriensis]
MTGRQPEEEPQEQSGQQDPVNHRPPEEWRPGDPGDPMSGGPQPPGEPPHGFPGDREQRAGGAGGRPGFAEPSGGYPPPVGRPAGQEPSGQEPSGQLSEGPSGMSQAGYEQEGYAPGYGETDVPGMGVGSFPTAGRPPADTGGDVPQEPGSDAPGGGTANYGPPPASGQAGAYGQYGQGQYPPGGPGYPPQGVHGPQSDPPTPWGKILGIGCGVLLLLLLVGGGCMAVGMFMAQNQSPGLGAPPDPGER